MLAEYLWRPKWMLAQWHGVWCVSVLVKVAWKTSHISDNFVANYLLNQKRIKESFLDCIMRCGVTKISLSWYSSPFSDIWIFHTQKSKTTKNKQTNNSRHRPQWIHCCALSFGIEKKWSFWFFWNPKKPSTLTVTLPRWLIWRCLLTSIGSGCWKVDCVANIFPVIMPTLQL